MALSLIIIGIITLKESLSISFHYFQNQILTSYKQKLLISFHKKGKNVIKERVGMSLESFIFARSYIF